MLLDSDKFRLTFWQWFDSLSKSERDKFMYYPSDMSELYFYNRIYRLDNPDETL